MPYRYVRHGRHWLVFHNDRLIRAMPVFGGGSKVIRVILQAITGQYQAAMGKASATTKGFGATARTAGASAKGSLMAVGVGATLAGVALVKGLSSAVRASVEFESNVTRMVTLVGVAKDEATAMGDAMLRMGDTGKGALELSDALFFITSAGLRGAEAMATLEASAKASAIGLGETKTIADAATSVMNAYGSETIDASRATDILAAAVRFGKLEADSLAGVLGNLVPTAAALNIPFEDIAGTLAVMSRTGTEAAQGATQIRSVMMALLSDSPKVVNALADVGLSVADLRDVASEQGLVGVMRMLNDAFDGNVEAMRRVFPNIRAFAGVMNALAQEGEDVDAVMRGVADSVGSVEEAHDEYRRTTEASLDRAGAAWENFKIRIGGFFSTFVESGANVLSLIGNLTSGFLDFGEEVLRGWGAVVADIFSGFDRGAEGGVARWGEAIVSAAQAAGGAASSTDRLVSSVADFGDEAEEAKGIAEALADAFDTITGAAFGLDEKTIAYKNSLATLKEALEENNGALNDNTQAGRDSREEIRKRLQAVIDLAGAEVNAGEALDSVEPKTRRRIAAIKDEAREAGISERAMNSYIRELNLTPDQIKTAIELAGYEAAMNSAESYQAALARIPRRVVTLLETRGAGSADVGMVARTVRHAGGPAGSAGWNRYHAGSPTLRADEIPAILQHGERVLSRRENAALAKIFSARTIGGDGGSITQIDARTFDINVTGYPASDRAAIRDAVRRGINDADQEDARLSRARGRR